MLMIKNAQLFTMHPSMPRGQAAVVNGNRFVFVGSEEGAHLFLGANPYQVLDAQGNAVLPGFNDAHLHYLHTVMQASRVNLAGTRSISELISRMRDGLARCESSWLIAEGWNQEHFADRHMPTREDLDSISTEIPIIASRTCGHIMTANSRALSMAGLSQPDGILREDQQDAVWRLIPAPRVADQLEWMVRGQQALLAKGITSIQSDDLGSVSWPDVSTFLHTLRDYGEDGRIKIRYSTQALLGSLDKIRSFFDQGLDLIEGRRYRLSCVKLLTDGSLGARTAWLNAPYADDPHTRGIRLYADGELTALVGEAATHGVPCAIHAIGDAAMQQTLDAFAAVGGGLRHAIVHAQITDDRQVVRCGQMGLCILAQPIFLDADAPIAAARVGESLANTSYRWRSMLSAGAHIAFSTDCPVEPFDPMNNLYCAITRRGLDGDTAYLPQEAFTLDEALYAYTAAGAYASGDENAKGRIWPGMAADFVLLDRPLNPHEPDALRETNVLQTYIDGECVYSK